MWNKFHDLVMRMARNHNNKIRSNSRVVSFYKLMDSLNMDAIHLSEVYVRL